MRAHVVPFPIATPQPGRCHMGRPKQGLYMHPPGLLAQLRNLGWISDGFGPVYPGVAQTARREANSKSFREPGSNPVQRSTAARTRGGAKAGALEAEEDNRPGRCHSKSQEPSVSRSSLATRADIRDLCNRRLLPLLPSPVSPVSCLPASPVSPSLLSPPPPRYRPATPSKNWRCASHKQLRLS